MPAVASRSGRRAAYEDIHAAPCPARAGLTKPGRLTCCKKGDSRMGHIRRGTQLLFVESHARLSVTLALSNISRMRRTIRLSDEDRTLDELSVLSTALARVALGFFCCSLPVSTLAFDRRLQTAHRPTENGSSRVSEDRPMVATRALSILAVCVTLPFELRPRIAGWCPAKLCREKRASKDSVHGESPRTQLPCMHAHALSLIRYHSLSALSVLLATARKAPLISVRGSCG